jgi:hypothetical protein
MFTHQCPWLDCPKYFISNVMLTEEPDRKHVILCFNLSQFIKVYNIAFIDTACDMK